MFWLNKKKSGKFHISYPANPLRTVGPKSNCPIALVIGHNSSSQGAVNYLGESEYTFNKRIAKKIQIKLRESLIKTVLIERPVDSYQRQVDFVVEQCKQLNCHISVHLHFNSSGVRARGCEVLVASGHRSTLDKIYADYITDELSKRLKFRERGVDGVQIVSKGHRGYKMLSAVRETSTIPLIVEPCFSDHRNTESITCFEHEDDYVNVLVDTLYIIARGEVRNG